MKGRTLEEIVAYTIRDHYLKEYGIAAKGIAAVALRPLMVWSGQELRVIRTVAHKRSGIGSSVVVTASDGKEYSFAPRRRVPVWHMNGKPFLIILPPENPGVGRFRWGPDSGGGSPAPAHDAAGIVPVWRGPQRPN